jgi:hypothetical protein
MASPPQEDPKPDGAAFDDFFESIGKKAEQLTINEQSEKSNTNGDLSAQKPDHAEEEQKVVDEIESLCMNCHENVRYPHSPLVINTNRIAGHHPFTTYSNTFLPRNHYHVLLLPSLQLQKFRDPVCR